MSSSTSAWSVFDAIKNPLADKTAGTFQLHGWTKHQNLELGNYVRELREDNHRAVPARSTFAGRSYKHRHDRLSAG
jgi:hypothetical protein